MKITDIYDQNGNNITEAVLAYVRKSSEESYRLGHAVGFTEGLDAGESVRVFAQSHKGELVDVYTCSCYTGYEPPMPEELYGEV